MKYIITGGPCTGKTTIINELKKLKFSTVPELARKVITKEQKKGKKGILPWTDLKSFELILIQEQVRHESKTKKMPVFLDRGLPDIIAYSKLGKVNLPKEIFRHIKEAKYTKVFFLEQLTFFENDAQRFEASKKEADKVHKTIHQTYKRLGYEIVRIPPVSVQERVKIILEQSR
ncbi:MAG: ATP-binding protein [Candidatus Woesearchaeota archaeon]